MPDYICRNTDKTFRYEHIRGNPMNFQFHLHELCEIYFLVAGDVNYFVENRIYPLQYGDLVITNPFEIHKPALQSEQTYERIVIQFDSSKLRAFSTPQFDLLSCFFDRVRGEQNKISLRESQLAELMELFHKFEEIENAHADAKDILLLSYMIELLVCINQIYQIQPEQSDITDQLHIHPQLGKVLSYIDSNLDSDLSLACLEQKFYINRCYLSKLFKNSTGRNLHEYIIFKRISKAKKLLSEGVSVTDACSHCGFNDYSNFLKMFKKTVGMSPGRYKSQR